MFAGQISLVGKPDGTLGAGVTKGNVYLDGNPICDDGWTKEDATVACRYAIHWYSPSLVAKTFCRMLGYGTAIPERGSPYGPASANVEFEYTEISCKGDEMNLLDCPLK